MPFFCVQWPGESAPDCEAISDWSLCGSAWLGCLANGLRFRLGGEYWVGLAGIKTSVEREDGFLA